MECFSEEFSKTLRRVVVDWLTDLVIMADKEKLSEPAKRLVVVLQWPVLKLRAKSIIN